MSIKNIPIIGKVLIILSLLGSVTIGAAVFSAGKIREIADGYTAAIDHEGIVALYAARANRTLMAARAAIADLEIATTGEGDRQAAEELKAARAGFLRFIGMVIGADQSGTNKLKEMAARGTEVIDVVCKKAIDLGATATTPAAAAAAQAEYTKSCAPAYAPLAVAMTAIVDQAVVDQNKIKSDLADLSRQTVVITYSVILGGLAVALLIGFFSVRAWVSRPVVALADAMRRLAGGDIATTITGAERRDEIGAMAQAVLVFKNNGLKLQESERQAAEERRTAEAERAGNEVARAAAVQQQEQVVKSLASGLSRLSKGDLVFRLGDRFAPDYEALRADFNTALEQLQTTMREVSGNTTAIRSGTGEIFTASDDLSRRTEQQAASLEETAAALNEITSTVKRTADGARHARDVVSTAKQKAERSGEIVRRAVDAMSAIAASSEQISRIIGVIDEIAFQTNLLALNAGVEAARAGDAGRGFAVVASEVRSLAQRSAEAAKEIKALITTSGQQVGSGVDLVAETGEALDEIVAQTAEINAIVAEIAASAQEQATGLDQVNTAVIQMDKVTQQNAAMVEESTAASKNLAHETEQLARLVARFRVDGGTADARRPVSRAA